MATRAVARRQSRGSARAVGGEIADRDLVGMYLDEIARTPLLDAAKEVELSQIIEAGVYAQQILDGETEREGETPSREELEALAAEESAPRRSSSAPTSASSWPSPAATRAAACPCST